MTSRINDLEKIKRQLKCDYLRYYGAPKCKLGFADCLYIGRKKEREEKERIKTLLKLYETPDNLSEKELMDFLYLRACLYMGKKPMGDFEGNAKICADVMTNGGDIVAMYRAGANAVYCACLSHYKLDPVMQLKVIDSHIPF